MLRLAIANLIHRKVRTALSMLAVAIAITLLLVLVGLSNGTLNEISQRMQSVEAEIVIRDKHFDLGSLSGGKLWEKEIPRLHELQIEGTRAVKHVMPVFLGRVKLANLSQNVFGVHPADFAYFAGPRKLIVGELFQDVDSPTWFLHPAQPEAKPGKTELPLIIDQRLARAAHLKLGDTALYGDITSRIVAIVETGVAGRVFAPINLLRGANGVTAPTAHMFFLKAADNLSTEQLQELCELIEQRSKRSATLVANYSQVLAANFRNLTIFVSLVSIIALIICFLFILVTIYTIVLERSREIAIMQSLGAGRRLILWQTLQEAMMICIAGTALGIGLAFAGRWLIQTAQPLMTVEIHAPWLGIAAAIALAGGILSALYPGYLALKHDPVETLSFE